MRRTWGRLLGLDSVIVVGWLASVGMVVLHERGQLLGGLGNPSTTLKASLEANEQWFGIYYQGQKLGFTQTTLIPEERDGVPGITVMDIGKLSFNLLGVPQQLEVRARAFIDADWRLQVFAASIRSATYHLQWAGQRHGEELLVTVSTPHSSVTKRIKDPTGSAFVNGLSSWVAFHRLRVGQSGKAWVLNPLALNPEMVYFTVRCTETVEGTETLVVETDVGGMTTTSWVTSEGNVLKETSPLGWELRRESQEQALKLRAEPSPALDLLSATSVPVQGMIESPERVDQLTLLVEGMESERIHVKRPWQRVLSSERLSDYHRPAPEAPWCLLQLDRPHGPWLAQSIPPELQRYQRPNLFVQSDDPRIIAKAKAIIGTIAEPWAQTMALNRWVYQTLTKQLTVGFPSAVDVLTTPVGACREHTVLFTALARSLQLPTRMIAGLVYQQGRLYYHAWPEVWLGQWVPTDPTLGQPIADATHIGLTEAENEQLLNLGQFIGKLRAQVLDVHVRETSTESANPLSEVTRGASE